MRSEAWAFPREIHVTYGCQVTDEVDAPKRRDQLQRLRDVRDHRPVTAGWSYVENGHVVPRFRKNIGYVGAEKSCAPGDNPTHLRSLAPSNRINDRACQGRYQPEGPLVKALVECDPNAGQHQHAEQGYK